MTKQRGTKRKIEVVIPVDSDDEDETELLGAPNHPCPHCNATGIIQIQEPALGGFLTVDKNIECYLCKGKKYFFEKDLPFKCVFNNCKNGKVTYWKDSSKSSTIEENCKICNGSAYTSVPYERCLACDGTGIGIERESVFFNLFQHEKTVSCKSCLGKGVFITSKERSLASNPIKISRTNNSQDKTGSNYDNAGSNGLAAIGCLGAGAMLTYATITMIPTSVLIGGGIVLLGALGNSIKPERRDT